MRRQGLHSARRCRLARAGPFLGSFRVRLEGVLGGEEEAGMPGVGDRAQGAAPENRIAGPGLSGRLVVASSHSCASGGTVRKVLW